MSLNKDNAGELLIWAANCNANELNRMCLFQLMNNRNSLVDGWLEELVAKGAPRDLLEAINVCRNKKLDNE